MDSFFKAFIEFITDIFAALADFLGWTIDYGDLTTTTAGAAEDEVENLEQMPMYY